MIRGLVRATYAPTDVRSEEGTATCMVPGSLRTTVRPRPRPDGEPEWCRGGVGGHAGAVRFLPRPPSEVTPSGYRRITTFAVVMLLVIVVTGAAVRLTGSGLGCSTWPSCEPGSLVPRDATSGHAVIEFVNRLVTVPVLAAVALALLGARRRIPRRKDLVGWSWVLVAGVAAQIVLGGMTVLFELAPPVVMGHYLLSAGLVAAAVVLHHRAAQPDRGERRPVTTPEIRALARGLVGAAVVVLVTGTVVTGSGPHAGDENAERLGFFLPDVTRVHTAAVWVLVALTLWAMWLSRRGAAAPGVERSLRILLFLEVAQGTVGYVQYSLGLPEGLVLVHVVGSMFVLMAAVAVLLRTTTVEPTRRPVPEDAGSPVGSGVG